MNERKQEHGRVLDTAHSGQARFCTETPELLSDISDSHLVGRSNSELYLGQNVRRVLP